MLNAIITTESVVSDPILAKGYQQFQILGLLGDTLIRREGQFLISAGLANQWEISDDKTVYTFHLQPKATFTDGSKVRAEDVVRSFQRHLGKSTSAVGGYLAIVIDSVSVGKNETVVFRLKGPYPNFLEMLAMPGFGVFKQSGAAVIGSGPFFIESTEGSTWRLRRRKDYFAPKGNVDQFCFRVERDVQRSIELLSKGEIDLAIGSPLEVALSPQILDKNIANAAFSLVTTPVFFNFSNPLLKSKERREAIAAALYQAREKAGFLTKFDRALDSFFPYGVLSEAYYTAGSNRIRSLKNRTYERFSGQRIKVVFPYAIFTEHAIHSMVESLRHIGLEVEYRNVKGKEYLDPLVNNDFDLFFIPYLGIIPDPDGFIDLLSKNFLGAHLTAPTDDILKGINKIRFIADEGKRTKAYETEFEKFENEFLMIPFSQNSIPIIASKSIKIPNLNFNFLNLREIDGE